MNTDRLTERFLRHATSRRGKPWRETTRRSARYVLNTYCAWLAERRLDLATVTRDDLRDYFDHRAALVSPAAQQNDWKALRALHRWLADEGDAEGDPMARIACPVAPATDVHVLAEGEYRALLATCDRRTTGGRRDEAMLAALWWGGLRRSELVGLDLADYDAVRSTLLIHTNVKGTSIRLVPLVAEAVEALDRYLDHRGDDAGPLFLSQHGDTPAERRLRPNSIQLLLRRRSSAAKLGRNVGAHEFRRAFATMCRRRQLSEVSTMQISGWTDARMIARYTRMDRDALAHDEFRAKVEQPTTARRRRNGARVAS